MTMDDDTKLANNISRLLESGETAPRLANDMRSSMLTALLDEQSAHNRPRLRNRARYAGCTPPLP